MQDERYEKYPGRHHSEAPAAGRAQVAETARLCGTQDPAGPFAGPVPEKFRHQVVAAEGGCWHWVGALQPNGYGRVKVGGRALMAHRAVYEAVCGPIPDGLQLDHLCRNRGCVNPAHLEPVTQLENTLRGNSAGAICRRTGRCLKGHEKKPGRECVTCWRERKRASRARLVGRVLGGGW